MATQLGPILQFRGVHQNRYRVSALVVLDRADAQPAVKITGGTVAAIGKLAEVPFRAPRHSVWRIDLVVSQTKAGQLVPYTIAGRTGNFHVPARGASPRLAFVSCNGFSDPKLLKDVDHKHDRWEHMQGVHAAKAYDLLVMGGDQIYSDGIWQEEPAIEAWTKLPKAARLQAPWSAAMAEAADRYFAKLYVSRWADAPLQRMLQSVPTVMMWDDHDIIDGWGSYPEEVHGCPVYQNIFKVATAYFHLFQQQLATDERHPAAIPGQPAYSQGFAKLGDLAMLVLDLRLERMPEPEQIVSAASWTALYNWLDQVEGHKHLLLVSSVPVSYLDLAAIEKLLGALPGQQELEDDLRDHWRSMPHRQERLRLIHRLLAHAEKNACRVTILSGDVHVGAASVIESERTAVVGHAAVINQLVSTGVVHPPPGAIVRYLLETVADKVDDVDRGIAARMLPIAEKGRYLIGARNWLAIEPDEQDARLWANWHVEGSRHPITKVIHPC